MSRFERGAFCLRSNFNRAITVFGLVVDMVLLERERDLSEDLSVDGSIILAGMLMRGFGLD